MTEFKDANETNFKVSAFKRDVTVLTAKHRDNELNVFSNLCYSQFVGQEM